MIESCYKRHKTVVNPIIDWEDSDVWEYINYFNVPYLCLYDEGFKRVGCIGCPMARKKNREIEFARWPKYKKLYLNAFEKMLEERQKNNLPTQWQTAQDVFDWWMEYDVLPGQVDIFDYMEDQEE